MHSQSYEYVVYTNIISYKCTSIIVSMKTFTYRWYLRLSAPLLWCPTTLMRFERHPPSKQPGKVPLWNETKWNWHHSWVSMHVRLCKNMDCYTYVFRRTDRRHNTLNGRWTKYVLHGVQLQKWVVKRGWRCALYTGLLLFTFERIHTPTPHVSERASLFVCYIWVWLATLSLPI